MKRILILLIFFGFCFGLAIPSHASLTDGLEVYYPFDEDAGNTIVDASGSGNDKDGTAYGNLQYTEGKFGLAAQFDGSSAYISGPSIELGTDDFTVSFWFKTTDTNGYMLDARSGADEIGYYLISFSSPQNGIYFGVKGTVELQTHNYGAPDGEWHMATGVRNGNTILLYIDGIQVDSNTTNDQYQLGDVDSPRIWLGKRYQDSAPTNYYDGLIDDFRLYSRALSEEEVTQLYNMSQVPIPASVWLMASGLLGLLSVRKREKSTKV